MKKITTLLFAFVTFLSCFSQVEVYKTLKDYQNNTPEIYTKPNFRIHEVTLTKDEKKSTIIYKNIWGFKYKNVLFRTIKSENFTIATLVSGGKITYWENGNVKIYNLDYPKSASNFKHGHDAGNDGSDYVYFSKTIESEIIEDDFRVFISQNPEYKKLAECVYNNVSSSAKKQLKLMNKLYKLGGVDDIALLKAIGKVGDYIEFLRDCVEEINK